MFRRKSSTIQIGKNASLTPEMSRLQSEPPEQQQQPSQEQLQKALQTAQVVEVVEHNSKPPSRIGKAPRSTKSTTSTASSMVGSRLWRSRNAKNGASRFPTTTICTETGYEATLNDNNPNNNANSEDETNQNTDPIIPETEEPKAATETATLQRMLTLMEEKKQAYPSTAVDLDVSVASEDVSTVFRRDYLGQSPRNDRSSWWLPATTTAAAAAAAAAATTVATPSLSTMINSLFPTIQEQQEESEKDIPTATELSTSDESQLEKAPGTKQPQETKESSAEGSSAEALDEGGEDKEVSSDKQKNPKAAADGEASSSPQENVNGTSMFPPTSSISFFGLMAALTKGKTSTKTQESNEEKATEEADHMQQEGEKEPVEEEQEEKGPDENTEKDIAFVGENYEGPVTTKPVVRFAANLQDEPTTETSTKNTDTGGSILLHTEKETTEKTRGIPTELSGVSRVASTETSAAVAEPLSEPTLHEVGSEEVNLEDPPPPRSSHDEKKENDSKTESSYASISRLARWFGPSARAAASGKARKEPINEARTVPNSHDSTDPLMLVETEDTSVSIAKVQTEPQKDIPSSHNRVSEMDANSKNINELTNMETPEEVKEGRNKNKLPPTGNTKRKASLKPSKSSTRQLSSRKRNAAQGKSTEKHKSSADNHKRTDSPIALAMLTPKATKKLPTKRTSPPKPRSPSPTMRRNTSPAPIPNQIVKDKSGKPPSGCYKMESVYIYTPRARAKPEYEELMPATSLHERTTFSGSRHFPASFTSSMTSYTDLHDGHNYSRRVPDHVVHPSAYGVPARRRGSTGSRDVVHDTHMMNGQQPPPWMNGYHPYPGMNGYYHRNGDRRGHEEIHSGPYKNASFDSSIPTASVLDPWHVHGPRDVAPPQYHSYRNMNGYIGPYDSDSWRQQQSSRPHDRRESFPPPDHWVDHPPMHKYSYWGYHGDGMGYGSPYYGSSGPHDPRVNEYDYPVSQQRGSNRDRDRSRNSQRGHDRDELPREVESDSAKEARGPKIIIRDHNDSMQDDRDDTEGISLYNVSHSEDETQNESRSFLASEGHEKVDPLTAYIDRTLLSLTGHDAQADNFSMAGGSAASTVMSTETGLCRNMDDLLFRRNQSAGVRRRKTRYR